MASANTVVVTMEDGREMLFSYGVLVAGFVPGIGYAVTDRKYSVTTSRHANAYAGKDATVLPDATLRGYFSEIRKAVAS